MTLGPGGVRFDLAPPQRDADMITRAAYAAMIRATKAARAGRQSSEAIMVEGDPAVVERITPVFSVAQQVATLDVEFPDV